MNSLVLAADPGTPAATLAALAASGDEAIRRRVAANPNTPAEALWSLAANFPAEVASNPALLLISFEQPDAIVRQPQAIQLALANCALTPPSCLAALVDFAQGEVLRKYPIEWGLQSLLDHLTENPATPSFALERLSGDRLPPIRRRAVRHPAIPASWVELLGRAGSLRECEGFQPPEGGLTREEATRLEAAGYWGQLLLARHPATPPEVRERLLDPRHPWPWHTIRQAVAACPATPVELLERMASQHDHAEIVAANPSLSAAWLERLGTSPSAGLRKAVAGNPSTPAALLRLMATGPDRAAAAQAATNPGLDLRWRELIVKAGLTADPGAPASLDDEDFSLLSAGGRLARQLVASHETSPFSLLLALLSDPDAWVRCALASRATLPDALRGRILEEKDSLVRAALASRADLAAGELAALRADRSPLVRCRLASNPALSDEEASRALDALLALKVPAGKEERKKLLDALVLRPPGGLFLERLVARADLGLRLFLLRNPWTPPAVRHLLDQLSGS